MRITSYCVCLLLTVLSTSQLSAQNLSTLEPTSLCDLQMKIPQGEHRTVRVEGVYLAGIEAQYLIQTGCFDRSTSVEFSLKSRRLVRQLVRLSNKSNARKHIIGSSDPVIVVFEGDFYGPRLPDPKLPDWIRRADKGMWDYGGSFTKLIVTAIDSVKPLPANHPCAPLPKDRWPCLTVPPAAPQNLANPAANPKP